MSDNYHDAPVHCEMCGKSFKRAQPYGSSAPLWGSTLTLHGGYAEFWDYGGEPDISMFEISLCHDCTLPIFRQIMGSVKYAHLKMDFFNHSHQNDHPSGEPPCCEYAYDYQD